MDAVPGAADCLELCSRVGCRSHSRSRSAAVRRRDSAWPYACLLTLTACGTDERRAIDDSWKEALRAVRTQDPAAPAEHEAVSTQSRELRLPDAILEPSRWSHGQLVLQGFFGIVTYENFRRTGGASPDIATDGDESFPMIGGGGMWKLAGERVDFGLEGMLSFSGRSNVVAFSSNSSGATLVLDFDLALFELYGGPFVNYFIDDNWRVYAAAGPLMQWADYAQSDTTVDDNSMGYGTGVYARAGFERRIYNGSLIGLGVRWTNSTIDLGSDLGDLQLDSTQFVFTVTEGF